MSNFTMRTYLTLLGIIGFSSWAWLVDYVFEKDGQQTIIYLLFAVMVFVGSTFALTGPLAAPKAVIRAAFITFVSTAIFAYLKWRFGSSSNPIPEDLSLGFLAVAISISWPFLITLDHKSSIWDYETLHESAWTIFIRGTVAFIFGWIILAIAQLANGLLLTVDFQLLNEFLNKGDNAFQNNALFYGFGFGIAAAVTWEMQKLLSVLRFVIVTLLRILLPILLLVMIIFVPLMVARPLDQAFGVESPTALLISILMLNALLVSAMIEGEATTGKFATLMNWLTKGVIVLSAIIAPFMIYGIAVRVLDYGWTPMRVFVAAIAILTSIYIFGYLIGTVFKRFEWRENLAKINIINALGIVTIALALCSPLANPFQMSLKSQLKVISDAPEKLTIYSLRNFENWGASGEELIAQIKEQNQFSQTVKQYTGTKLNENKTEGELRAELSALLRVYPDTPEAHIFAKIFITGTTKYNLLRHHDDCSETTQKGNPKCALIVDPKLGNLTSPDAYAVWFEQTGNGSLNTIYYDQKAQPTKSLEIVFPKETFDILAEKGYRFEQKTIEVLVIE